MLLALVLERHPGQVIESRANRQIYLMFHILFFCKLMLFLLLSLPLRDHFFLVPTLKKFLEVVAAAAQRRPRLPGAEKILSASQRSRVEQPHIPRLQCGTGRHIWIHDETKRGESFSTPLPDVTL